MSLNAVQRGRWGKGATAAGGIGGGAIIIIVVVMVRKESDGARCPGITRRKCPADPAAAAASAAASATR